MDGTIVKLTKPVEVFGQTLNEITLREPTGKLYSRLGDPRIPIMNATSGSGYWVDREEIISQYLDTLIDIPEKAGTVLVLAQLSLPDMMSLRKALFDFFLKAGEKAAEMRQTSSPSA